MSRKTLRLACAVVALSCPAFGPTISAATGQCAGAVRQSRRRAGDPADARHDPRSGKTGRGQQARRGRGQHRDRLADQPARQCLVCSGTVDADRADRQGLPDRAELLRPHRPALADRVGHQLQSGRTGEQRQLQPGSGGRRRSCGRQRRFLCLHAHGRARTSCRWPRRLCSRAVGSWLRSRARRSRSRSCWSRAGETTTPISRCRWGSEVRTPRVRRPARSRPTPLRPF